MANREFFDHDLGMHSLKLVLLLMAAHLALLVPGLFLPVLTVSGELEAAGIASIAPELLDQGVSEDSVKSLRPLLNPLVNQMLGTDASLKAELLKNLAPKIAESLRSSASKVEVYSQQRSIVGSVQHLYEVGNGLAASLILIFSVLVPLAKMGFVVGASFQNAPSRMRTLRRVAFISKWSMADVFAVALFITFLAARASASPSYPDGLPPLVTFTATFGPGFYWFTAYCLISLATNQWLARKVAMAD